MSLIIAAIIVYALLIYVAGGAVFAVWFVVKGAERIDDAARGSGFGFKVVIFAGAVALWIFLALKIFLPAKHHAKGREKPRKKTATANQANVRE